MIVSGECFVALSHVHSDARVCQTCLQFPMLSYISLIVLNEARIESHVHHLSNMQITKRPSHEAVLNQKRQGAAFKLSMCHNVSRMKRL